MKRTALFVIALGLCLARLSAAQTAKPNFTGKWLVQTIRFEVGAGATPGAPPGSQVIEVDHQEPKLKIGSRNYTTDGKEILSTAKGAQSKSRASWDETRLIIESKADVGGTTLETKETWELSHDLQTLTITKETQRGDAKSRVKMIYRKQ